METDWSHALKDGTAIGFVRITRQVYDRTTNPMLGRTILTFKTSRCNAYTILRSHRVMTSSTSLTLDLLDICIFCMLLSL